MNHNKQIQVQSLLANFKTYIDKGYGCEILDFAFPDFSIERISAAYQGQRVESMHAAFVDNNFASREKEICRVSRELILRSVEAGVSLGAKNVVVHSSFYPVLKNEELLREWCISASSFLLELVAKFPISVFVENTLDISPLPLLRLMETAQHPRIGVCFDIGHSHLCKTHLEEWVRTLHPYIGYLHVNDNNGIYDEHLALGDGTIAWAEFRQLLRKYAINPIVTLEMSDEANIEKSLQLWNSL